MDKSLQGQNVAGTECRMDISSQGQNVAIHYYSKNVWLFNRFWWNATMGFRETSKKIPVFEKT